MNELEDFFFHKSPKLEIFKAHHYFDIYDRHFRKFMGRKPRILEIGVRKGGSLEMWRHYFGGECEIFGVDVNEDCRNVEKHLKGVKIFIGDQEDRTFWRNFKNETPTLDIIIDDGGHKMQQQIVTFEELYGHMSSDGVYLCEDIGTSYFAAYGGGLERQGTFIEFSKTLIDKLNAWHWQERNTGDYSTFVKQTNSLHFYDNVVVIEREQTEKNPDATIQGTIDGTVPP
jgi:hypothetical protein